MRKEIKPLHERGRYRLVYDRGRGGSLRSPFIQIVWYDSAAGRNRSRSTGTTDLAKAEQQLDALYAKQEHGKAICPHCGQVMQGGARHLLTTAIADYLDARAGRVSISAIKPRLGHVLAYLQDHASLDTVCEAVDEDWIEDFREWATSIPIEFPNHPPRNRAPGTIEASVRQLAAAINFAKKKGETASVAKFKPKKPSEVSNTPHYRADVETLSEMFRYCTDPVINNDESDRLRLRQVSDRRQLLRFLQISISTWARPDAAHDVSVEPGKAQWHSKSKTLNLNPKGRTQTKKFRPIIPIAHQMAALLDAHSGCYVEVASVRQAFETMQAALGLPGDRESGMKLIRRSMAQIGRQRLGERDWIEGKIMLGHHRVDSSDTYAPFNPGFLSRARAVTEDVIDEIIALVPEAFAPTTGS